METKEIKAPVKAVAKKDTWELKDRYYHLVNGQSPLTTRLNSRHSSRKPLMWFDEDKGYSRELRYATNMKSPFMDEQKGTATLGHIVFENGVLMVPKQNQPLQKLLSLYHPNKGGVYSERDEVIEAGNELDNLELQVEAMAMAMNMDVDKAEAILRVELGSKVSSMSSKELRRDLLVFARNNPKLFLELADDENVMLRNFGIKAVEDGILRLSSDQRNFLWGSTGRKIMVIPFDEHPYTALAHWFKTDEGMEIYSNIEKRLNN